VRLLPRDEKFFDLFTQVAELNVEAAAKLLELITAEDVRRGPIAEAIKRYEHQADEITHQVVSRLDRSFITPLDREDIHMLASRLDDILDRIDGTARRTVIFRPGSAPKGAVMLAEVVHRATQRLLDAVKVLDGGKTQVVINACIEVKRMEEEGDAIYHEWLAKLFDGQTEALSVMKWKEIYDTLEKTLDQAEDVANVLESIAIKHS
jgi:predicted phosphate transport protein (TIGR00153 family)